MEPESKTESGLGELSEDRNMLLSQWKSPVHLVKAVRDNATSGKITTGKSYYRGKLEALKSNKRQQIQVQGFLEGFPGDLKSRHRGAPSRKGELCQRLQRPFATPKPTTEAR